MKTYPDKTICEVSEISCKKISAQMQKLTITAKGALIHRDEKRKIPLPRI
jgi:hypothetical protein